MESCFSPVSALRLKANGLDIAYTMTANDWVYAYRVGMTHIRFDAIKLVALGGVGVLLAVSAIVFHKGYVHAWQSHHAVPWQYIRTTLLASCFGPISFVLITSFFLWSGATRKLTLQNLSIVIRVKGGKNVVSWKRVTAIFKNAEYLAICSGDLNALVVPVHAFPGEQEATEFYDAALNFWHEAKGTLPPPAQNASEVWPPAPTVANSAEPGDDQ